MDERVPPQQQEQARPQSEKNTDSTIQRTEPCHLVRTQTYSSIQQRRKSYGDYLSRSVEKERLEWKQAREDFYDDQLAFHEEYEDRELLYLTGSDAERLEQSDPIEIEENWQQQRDLALVEQLEQSEHVEQQELLQQFEFHEPLKHSQQQPSSSSSSSQVSL
jgi:hypothetical protein